MEANTDASFAPGVMYIHMYGTSIRISWIIVWAEYLLRCCPRNLDSVANLVCFGKSIKFN